MNRIDSVVTWKWRQRGYHKQFTGEHVNALKRMVRKHYPLSCRFICITDDATGIDDDVEIVPLGDLHAEIPNPTWGRCAPSCYRRLRCFAPEFEAIAGRRFVSLDLDVVLTGDLRALWHRPEDFVIYQAGTVLKQKYNGSMFMMTAGSRRQVWDQFDPIEAPKRTAAANLRGTDQAWIQHVLGDNEATWTADDGVFSYLHNLRRGQLGLPSRAKVVVFYGKLNPWDKECRNRSPWIEYHYGSLGFRTFTELVSQYAGARICVMGGAASLEADLQLAPPADVYISTNGHGARLVKPDLVWCMDEIHCEKRTEMKRLVREVTDAPIIGPSPHFDIRLNKWPGFPRRVYTGLVAAWGAWVLGGHPVLLAGFDGYHGEDRQGRNQQRAPIVAAEIHGPVRVLGREMAGVWPQYQPGEDFGPWQEHGSIRGLLGIDEQIKIRVRKPSTIFGQEWPPETEMLVPRFEVHRLLKHKMVIEL